MAWLTKTWQAFTTASAADLNQFRPNLEILKLHSHDGTDGGGGALTNLRGGWDYVQILPFYPYSNTGWGTRTIDTTAVFTGYLETDSSSAGNLAKWYCHLRNGTWRIDVCHGKGADNGIMTFTYGALTLGTVDCYNAATSYNNDSAVTGITVNNFAVSTPYYLTVTMATKNASASAYRGRLQFIALRRTGA